MKFLSYVREAISTLGYVKPEFDTALAIMLESKEGYHPRDIALSYRKIEPQLSIDAKRSLGLRANTHFSVEAFESLTQKGLEHPIEGLTTTLLRVMFGYFRDQHIANGQTHLERGLKGWFELSRLHNDCLGCDRLDGTKLSGDEVARLPPADCGREACSLLIIWQTDWLADLD